MRLTFLVFEFYRHRSASRSRAMVAMSVLMLDCYWLMLSDCFVHHERSRQCVVCQSQKRECHYRWSLADRAPCNRKTEKIFIYFYSKMCQNFHSSHLNLHLKYFRRARKEEFLHNNILALLFLYVVCNKIKLIKKILIEGGEREECWQRKIIFLSQ